MLWIHGFTSIGYICSVVRVEAGERGNDLWNIDNIIAYIFCNVLAMRLLLLRGLLSLNQD